jgi:NAD(P) transhydrogenase subunit beta
MQDFAQYADWFYLIGAVLFILTLRGLSGPKTRRSWATATA